MTILHVAVKRLDLVYEYQKKKKNKEMKIKEKNLLSKNNLMTAKLIILNKIFRIKKTIQKVNGKMKMELI